MTGSTFDDVLAELAALTPHERDALVSQLNDEERIRLTSAQGRISHGNSTSVAFSPWLSTLISGAAGSLTPATKRALEGSVSASHQIPQSAAASPRNPDPSASLLQVAGSLLRGKSAKR